MLNCKVKLKEYRLRCSYLNKCIDISLLTEQFIQIKRCQLLLYESLIQL